jgi:signal transduction histidine kinase
MTNTIPTENLASILTNDELEALYSISLVIAETNNFDQAFDQIFKIARPMFIFDNIVIYQKLDEDNIEPVFARAVGRGRATPAEISWGDLAVSEVMKSGGRFISESPLSPHYDRLDQPFILGLPIKARGVTSGVLVFVRFGGPTYTEQHIRLAEIFATHISHFFERQNLIGNIADLEATKKINKLQETFIAMITHELNTPIGFIKGYATTLLRQDANWDQKTQDEFLHIIDEETDRLSELINALLDSSRLQTGTLPMEIKKTNISKLVISLVERLSPRFKEITIRPIIQDLDLIVLADTTRISAVVENLIANAAKYAPNSTLKIKLEAVDGDAQLSFEDNGPGIPDQYIDRIFTKFFRVPTNTSSVRGTGLGLFICKQIVKAHQGTISVVSNVDKGTKFIIKLPLCKDD